MVRDVSLSLNRGEAVGLLGPNGAGKTTCFYMITGLIPCDTGSILLDGVGCQPPADVSPRAARPRLSAAGGVDLPRPEVEDNLRAVLEIVEPDRRRRDRRVDALLGEFSITHLRRAPASGLSGGERRRVEIARCLATNPAYVLLDEPFAGIDPIAVGDIRGLVGHLKGAASAC